VGVLGPSTHPECASQPVGCVCVHLQALLKELLRGHVLLLPLWLRLRLLLLLLLLPVSVGVRRWTRPGYMPCLRARGSGCAEQLVALLVFRSPHVCHCAGVKGGQPTSR
jgi:hypothetical protein